MEVAHFEREDYTDSQDGEKYAEEGNLIPLKDFKSRIDEIVYSILVNSEIEKSLPLREWADLIKIDFNFSSKNNQLLGLFKKSFPYINRSCMVGLLKLTLKLRLNIFEVLNIFFMVNSALRHLSYYDYLITTNNYSHRIIDEEITNQYFFQKLNKDFIFLFSNYKCRQKEGVNYNEQSIFCENIHDRRRSIKLDSNKYFSYICFRCEYDTHSIEDEFCPFSHNRNEILYHPLLLKTRMCNNTHCNKKYCNLSHNTKEDFRILFNRSNDKIKAIIKICFIYEIFPSNRISASLISKTESDCKMDILPSEFNPDSYKTIACPLGSHCKLDSKLCLNYHNESERRRDPRKTQYQSINCPSVIQNKKFIDRRNCKEGDNCNHCHNMFEYIYHKDNFRKKQCGYERRGEACDYIIICPFKHESDINNIIDSVIVNERILTFYKENLKTQVLEQFEKLKTLQGVLDNHKCLVCREDLKKKYNLLECCQGLICSRCSFIAKESKQCNICNQSCEAIKEIEIKTIL